MGNRIIITLCFLLVAQALFAQVPFQYIGTTNNRVIARGQFRADSSLILPKRIITANRDTGAVYYRLADSSVYVWTGSQWRVIAGSGTSNTFTNGLTESGGVVRLGGTLEEETTINGQELINFIYRQNNTNSIYKLTQQGIIVIDTLINNIGSIVIDKPDSNTVISLNSGIIKINGGDGNTQYSPVTSLLTNKEFLVRDTTTGALSRYTGSVLTAVPTLQQVTGAGKRTTDSLIVIDPNGNRIISAYTEFSAPTNYSPKLELKTNTGRGVTFGFNSIDYNFPTGSGQLRWPDSSYTNQPLSVGARLNGSTIMAGTNGIIDLGTVGGTTINGTGFVKANGTSISYDNSTFRKDIDTIPLATFTVGAGISTDTAAFQTTGIYGSFYVDGTDTLFITSYRVAMQGTSPSVVPEIFFNDSLNVTAGATKLVNSPSAITNTVLGTSVSVNINIPQGNWVFLKFTTLTTKPTYFTLTLFGYRKRKA